MPAQILPANKASDSRHTHRIPTRPVNRAVAAQMLQRWGLQAAGRDMPK
jgi:hypothetical protein